MWRTSPFLIKLRSWEYWPAYIVNIPTVLFWLYFALRSRSLFFFSVVNPAIETGGVLGESKINILRAMPPHLVPATVFVHRDAMSWPSVQQELQQSSLRFPLIAKPNIGERGFLVQKLESVHELQRYFYRVQVDFMIQEYVDLPLEVSVLHHRTPDSEHGRITSLCYKETLKVVGDGQHTVKELMQQNPRAVLQRRRLEKESPELLGSKPALGMVVELEPIGNHCRGTKFLNGNGHITPQMQTHFDGISRQLQGIFYGRFDIKCRDWSSLESGRDLQILEFNGVASEPAHIYDPAYSLVRGYRDLFDHWKVIYRIAKIQRGKGVRPMGLREAVQRTRAYLGYLRSADLHS